MHLSPRELDKLTLHAAGSLAQKRLARGVRLFFTHDAECAMASVTRDANQRFGVTDVMAELNGLALAA